MSAVAHDKLAAVQCLRAGLRLCGVAGLLLVSLLAACAHHSPGAHRAHGGGYYQNDGPPDGDDVDISSIPDAVPQNAVPSAYGNPTSYNALGKTYYPLKSAAGFTQTGLASWYGRQFHEKRTSSGEPYDMFSMTAAHKRLPLPTWVLVTNLENGRHCIVKINDRGPFHDGRIIDLSYVAARRLGIVANGSARVRIRTVTPADYRQIEANTRLADNNSADPTLVPLRSAQNPAPATPEARPTRPPKPKRAALPKSAGRATPPPPATDASGGMLQVGAFAERDNALELKSRLLTEGLSPVIILPPSRTLALYRVRVGPFNDRRARSSAAQQLVADGYPVRDVKR